VVSTVAFKFKLRRYNEVHELYLRVLLNPFHTPRTPIASPVFDARVRSIAKKHFP
jgi:hypothetical protein